jgi:hypothetical protein
MNNPNPPALRRIIETDYYAYLGMMFPMSAWVFYFLLVLLKTDLRVLLYITSFNTILAIPFLFWRLRMILGVFEDSQVILARSARCGSTTTAAGLIPGLLSREKITAVVTLCLAVNTLFNITRAPG